METLRKDYTSALVLNDNGEMLMQLKDNSYPFWPNSWATFGGGMKNGETFLECMMREFESETGIKIENFIPFCEQDFFDKSRIGGRVLRSGRIYYFSAGICEKDARQIKITEGANYGFFNRWELRRFRELGFIVPYQYDIIEKFFDSPK